MFRDIPSSALMQIESRPVLIRLHGRLRTTDFIIIILIFITHTQTKKNPVERERERERAVGPRLSNRIAKSIADWPRRNRNAIGRQRRKRTNVEQRQRSAVHMRRL